MLLSEVPVTEEVYRRAYARLGMTGEMWLFVPERGVSVDLMAGVSVG